MQIALLTPAHQRPHGAPARAQQGPPLAPRAAHARRPASPAAQLHAAQRPRGLPLAHPRARPSSVSRRSRGHHRAGHAGAGVLPGPRRQDDVHAGGPARQDDRPRLLSLRLQPGLHRPAAGLRRGPRRARRAGRDALRRLLRPRYSQTAFRERLGVEIEQLSDWEPKGEASRAFGAYFAPRGLLGAGAGDRRAGRGRAVVAPRAESLGDLPGANLIFDALAAPAS